jgi:hypothetical protein
LASRQSPARKISQRKREIAAIPAETLLAKVVRHAGTADGRQAFVQGVTGLDEISQSDAKVVAGMGTASKFAKMTRFADHANAFQVDFLPVSLVAGRPPDAEPLRRHGMPVFHSGITHVGFGDTGEPGESGGYPAGIGTIFLDQQIIVFAITAGLETKLFVDPKVCIVFFDATSG